MSSLTQQDRTALTRMRVINFLYGLTSSVMNYRVLYLSQQGLSATESGIVMCAAMVVGAITPPIWGMVADSLRSKYRVFILTAFGLSVTCALVPTLGLLHIGGLLMASLLIPCTSAFSTPCQGIVDAAAVSCSMSIPGGDYSRLRMWMSIGYTLGNLALTPLVAGMGASISFFASAGFALILITQAKTVKDYEAPVTAPSEEAGVQERVSLSLLFKNYYLMIFLLINILICIPSNCSQFLVYLLEDIGADTSLVGLVVAFRVAIECLALLFSANLKRRMPFSTLMILSAVCFCIEMLGYQFTSDVVTLTISCCFGGAAYGFVVATGINYVNMLCPRAMQATAVSVWLSGGQLAGMVCMLAGGAIIDALGVRAAFLCGLVCALLWIILYLGSYFFGVKVLKKEPPITLKQKA
ncbi:MAG: MFS transporter [Clostridiales bacterium]|nr:MFS transporter [Clostridiales bacterium]